MIYENFSRKLISRSQLGFSLIELMIALLIGLFLVGGLLTVMQQNKRTFTSQNSLSVLQDNERLAMTMITDVIQQAGYFPNPTVNSAPTMLPAYSSGPAGAMLSSQSINGTYLAAAPGDTITARYTTASGDGVVNCIGAPNTSGANYSYVSTFKINPQNQLICTTEAGIAYPLVNGVVNLSVLYGVNTLGTSNNVDTYMNASQVTPAWWNKVLSIRVSLTFTNPLWVNGQAGIPQPQFYVLSRDIAIMNQTGI